MVNTDEPARRVIYNSGLAFAHPLESSHARALRWVLANPCVRLPVLKQEFESSEALGLESDPERFLPTEISCRIPRQCPSCAGRLFHPLIYQLPALQRCPIHREALTIYCPACKRRWRRPHLKKTGECAQCCESNRVHGGQTQLPAKAYRRLGWLSRWVWRTVTLRNANPRLTLHNIRTHTGWLGNSEGPRFQAPSLDHPWYLAFEAAKNHGRDNARLQALQVVTVEARYRQRFTPLEIWKPQPEERDYFLPHAKHQMPGTISMDSRVLVTLALRRLLRWHNGTIGQRHAMAWRDYSSIRPEDYSSSDALCVVCLAFSLWCQAVTMKHFNPMRVSTTGNNEVCRITRYEQFPVTAEGVYVRHGDTALHRPSREFERWFYLRSTDYLFLELIHLATWFRQRLIHGSPHYSQTFYHSSHQFARPALASQLLDVVPAPGGMRVAYLYASPLDEIRLPRDTLDKTQRCCSSPKPGAPLLWSLPGDGNHPTVGDLDQFFRLVAPGLHQAGSTYRWWGHIWASVAEQPQPGIDTRVSTVG